MKKKILIFFILLVTLLLSCNKKISQNVKEEKIESPSTVVDIDSILTESFNFDLRENLKYESLNEKDRSLYNEDSSIFQNLYRGTIYYSDGQWNAVYNSSFGLIELIEIEKNTNEIILSIQLSNFIIRGYPNSYWDWSYPNLYEIKLTSDILLEILNSNDETKGLNNFFCIDDIVSKYGNCHAIIITDNLRIRTLPNTSSESKVIGVLNKFQDVELIDCTKEKDEIDGILAPWYKVNLEDGTDGWIFGGFAKIYFSVKNDKERIIKAFEKEGSEYTNQFPTPDNS